MKALARRRFENVVDLFALVKSVKEGRERAEIECRRPAAEQMIADARQLGENDAQILAARGQLDAHELFDRVMPGHLVGDRRDVIHPIDDGDILIEIEILAQLFEAGMQIADVGNGLDDGFAVERQDEAQRGVRGRMLRTEIERPQILLLGSRPASGLANPAAFFGQDER